MDHGMKISKQGESVTEKVPLANNSTPQQKKEALPYILYAMALPYLFGCKTQVERYQKAAKIEQPITKVYICLHESSCLFEDLCTIAKYTEKCGDTHELNALWIDIRNHIRHDIREEMDNDDSKQKAGRAKRLQLNPKLQFSMGYEVDVIKVGGTIVKIDTIKEYIAWAESVIESIMKPAIDAGKITGMTYNKDMEPN